MTSHALKDNGTQGEWNDKRQAEITIYIYIFVYCIFVGCAEYVYIYM